MSRIKIGRMTLDVQNPQGRLYMIDLLTHPERDTYEGRTHDAEFHSENMVLASRDRTSKIRVAYPRTAFSFIPGLFVSARLSNYAAREIEKTYKLEEVNDIQ